VEEDNSSELEEVGSTLADVAELVRGRGAGDTKGDALMLAADDTPALALGVLDLREKAAVSERVKCLEMGRLETTWTTRLGKRMVRGTMWLRRRNWRRWEIASEERRSSRCLVWATGRWARR